MTQTSRYALPFLQAGQAQKEVTHNDALARIDVLLQITVASRQAAAGPGTNATASIVPPGATGAWAGYDGQIAAYDDSGWSFLVPRDGCLAYVQDEDIFVHYRAGEWRDAWPVRTLAIGGQALAGGIVATVVLPVGGAVIDVEARAGLGQLVAALHNMGIVATR